MQVTVRDLMTTQPLTISELTSVEEATRKILERAACELYVVDDSGRLLGTISDYSLLKARMIQSDSQEPVAKFISRKMLLLTPDMRLDEVAGYFRESCYPRLAVIDDGRIVGQLSRRDVLRAMVVLEELATASADDDLDVAESCDLATAAETGRIHRLESPAEASLPTPAGLRTMPEAETKTDRSLGALAAR
jgi:predicted transcriptional regulator